MSKPARRLSVAGAPSVAASPASRLPRLHRTSSVLAPPGHQTPLHRPLHIQLKPDPIGDSRSASWLAPIVPGATPTLVTGLPSASPRFALKPPTSDAAPPSPLVSERSRAFAPSRFRRSVQSALRRLELQLWRSKLIPLRDHRPRDSEEAPWLPVRLLRSLLLGLTRLIFALVSVLWVPSASRRTTGSPHHTRDSCPDRPARFDRWISTPSRKLGLGRKSYMACLALFLLGVREVLKKVEDPDHGRARASSRARRQVELIRQQMLDAPFDFLHQQGFLPELTARHDELGLAGRWVRPRPGIATARGSVEPDVTAVVLNWNRPENVLVIVAHLCRYDFFQSVIVWNNNSKKRLQIEDFSKSECPSHKLSIINAPTNLYFFSRYLACMQSLAQYCYFQDDDAIVTSIRTMYQRFKLQPDFGRVVVQANPTYSVMYGWEWCFRDQPGRLHTCFAWLGHGSFVSKETVASFLDLVSSLALPADTLALADNFFTTSLNRAPLVIVTPAIASLPSLARGFSDGHDGLERNRLYIQKGVEELSRMIASSTDPLTAPPTVLERVQVIRSTNQFDSYSFITNVEVFPSPLAKDWPSNSTSLAEWEDELGGAGRELGTERNLRRARRRKSESGAWGEGEKWAIRYPYSAAIDGDLTTAWRSIDAISRNDYIGLNFLDQLTWPLTNLTLDVVIDRSSELLKAVSLEIMVDGARWVPVSTMGFICTPTGAGRAERRMVPYPDVTGLSARARAHLRRWKGHRGSGSVLEYIKRRFSKPKEEKAYDKMMDGEDEDEDEGLGRQVDAPRDNEGVGEAGVNRWMVCRAPILVEGSVAGLGGVRLTSLLDQEFGWTVWDMNLRMG